MKTIKPTIRPPFRGKRPGGFTVLEVLLSLIILAVLLTAVAAATKASVSTYTENTKIADVTQTARVILNKMGGELRTSQAVNMTATGISITPAANAQGLTDIRYELVSGALYYRRTINGVTTSAALIASDETVKLQALELVRQTAVDGGGNTYTTVLTARLSLTAGANPLFVSSSVRPRAMLSY